MTMHELPALEELCADGAEVRAVDLPAEEDHPGGVADLSRADHLIGGGDEGEVTDTLPGAEQCSGAADDAGGLEAVVGIVDLVGTHDAVRVIDPAPAEPAEQDVVVPPEQHAPEWVSLRPPGMTLPGADPVAEQSVQERPAPDQLAPAPSISAAAPIAPGLDPGTDGPVDLPEPTAGTAPADDQDDPAWRDHWPDNQLHVVTRLLPRYSQAPALDGAVRGRMLADYLEQDDDGQYGAMGSLPIYLVPTAIGLTTITAAITRAQKRKERLAPITVELTGISRQLQDRDGRYAHDRFTTAMALEAWTITRVADKTPQTALWRGRGRVVETRPYTLASVGVQYQRVTLIVASRQQRPGLRGISIRHTPVDMLVAPDHPHAERFRVGQRLLVEARVDLHTIRLRDDHPELEGLDPEQKARLNVVRNANLQVTMGEFPDDAAEADFARWVRAGRPLPPPRPARRDRLETGPGPAARVPAPTAARREQPPTQAAAQPRHVRRQPPQEGTGQHRSASGAVARGMGEQGKQGPKREKS